MKNYAVLFALVIFFSIGTEGYAQSQLKRVTETGLENELVRIPLAESGEFRIEEYPQGQKIVLEGYGHLNLPGTPMLPAKTFLIALPPGAKAVSAEVSVIGQESLPGSYRIMPAARVLPLAEGDGHGDWARLANEEWHRSHAAVYGSDKPFPAVQARLTHSGTFRQYAYAAVSLCPFSYHPQSGRLARFKEAWITVHYTLPDPGLGKAVAIKSSPLDHQEAASLFHNFSGMEKRYGKKPMQPDLKWQPGPVGQPIHYDYLIITDSSLTQAVVDSRFLAWKASLNYDVKIVQTSDSIIADAAGQDLPEKIRTFLRNHYGFWGIRYLLIVGHHTQIPMRVCYPDPADYLKEIPTDYYYADLSAPDGASWDSDGDGIYGEYGQDTPDFLAEVYVGRIPTVDPARVTYALNKIVAYEQDTGAWKQQALAPSSFWYFEDELFPGLPTMDAGRCQNQIEIEVMSDWSVVNYTEQAGILPSIYPGYPINQNTFHADWRDGQYGVVVWSSHGASLGAGVVRKFWNFDDGDGLPEPFELRHPFMINTNASLEDDYPSVVFAFSCDVGNPLPLGDCLGMDLLVKPGFGAAVGIVCSSRVLYAEEYWPGTQGGSDSICLEFCRNMITDSETLGESLYHAKHSNHINHGWDFFAEYVNMYIWNLFGDPSMMQAGR